MYRPIRPHSTKSKIGRMSGVFLTRNTTGDIFFVFLPRIVGGQISEVRQGTSEQVPSPWNGAYLSMTVHCEGAPFAPAAIPLTLALGPSLSKDKTMSELEDLEAQIKKASDICDAAYVKRDDATAGFPDGRARP